MNSDSSAGRKVLLIDDDPITRELIKYTFKKAGGYHVITAGDVREGLALVLRNSPDIVLSKVFMPRMDGFTLCRDLKQNPETSAIPIILLAERCDSELTVQGFQAGADDCIAKPFTSKVVLARVSRVLHWMGRKKEKVFGISGNLEKTPIFDLINFCETHRISGIIHLTRWILENQVQTKIIAKIHLCLGEIIAIHYKDIDDVSEALDELLEWPDGMFTIEQEELQLPVLSSCAVRDSAEEDLSLEQHDPDRYPEASHSFSPHIRKLACLILDELKIQSGNLKYADIAGPSGDSIYAVGPLASDKPVPTREAFAQLIEFSKRIENELALGPLDETMLMGEEGIVLLYQLNDHATMAVVAPEEGQGLTRWNCKDALEKLTEVFSS